MDIVNPDIDRYLHDLASPIDPVLREMEVLAAEKQFPIVGPQVGRLLFILARTCRARRVIELGSGFGYSAYWFALALEPGGEVILTDTSEENVGLARDFLGRGGLLDRVRIERGDALEVIDRIGGEFDLVFNDIDKERYPEVLDRASAALRQGGLLVSDNMLWYGTVLEDDSVEQTTRGVQELTRALYDTEEFFSTILPVRDGVSVSVRR
jgi:predicted O-methyltransferase YrrM